MIRKISTEPCAAIQKLTGQSKKIALMLRGKKATQKVTLAHTNSKPQRSRLTRDSNSACVMDEAIWQLCVAFAN
jgi:hypothetical protein